MFNERYSVGAIQRTLFVRSRDVICEDHQYSYSSALLASLPEYLLQFYLDVVAH